MGTEHTVIAGTGPVLLFYCFRRRPPVTHDEFIDYCQALGTEPYICLNMGTGTLEEALAWIEYCNGTQNTHWANLRRANGHAEPYNIRYWGLGNEMWGDWQVGHLTADEYVAKARSWANALRRLDRTIELVGCGRDGWSDWDRVVVDGLALRAEDATVGRQQVASLHAGGAGAGADEQADVGAVERGLEVVGDVDPGQQR